MRDLELLTSDVHDSNSKDHFREAVYAYQAGAHRASIITVWTSVVFDLTAKIRFLAETGYSEAELLMAQLDKAIHNNDKASLQQYETDILRKAHSDFELISHHEARDLARLHEDRHLCAHPAFVEPNIPFIPSAERVRSYLALAVDAVLSRPPVPGKQIIERFSQLVLGNSWPAENLEQYLRENYFSRTKTSLQRSLAQVIVKGCFNPPPEASSVTIMRLQRAALSLRTIDRTLYADTLKDVVHKRERALGMDDQELLRALSAFGDIEEFWTLVPNGLKDRAAALIRDAPLTTCIEQGLFRMQAPADNIIADICSNRMAELGQAELSQLVSSENPAHLLPRAIQILGESKSYRDAESNMRNVLALSEFIGPESLALILKHTVDNNQISLAAYMQDLLQNLFEQTRGSEEEISLWQDCAQSLRERQLDPNDYYAYPTLNASIESFKNK